MDVSLYFCGHKYFDYELYMNKYGSNYHIRMDLNILVCHYNYLTFDHCHYLILVFTCKYVYDYTLNIVNTHSFFVSFTLQPNTEWSDSVLFPLFNQT
jgi:hypothetical protein